MAEVLKIRTFSFVCPKLKATDLQNNVLYMWSQTIVSKCLLSELQLNIGRRNRHIMRPSQTINWYLKAKTVKHN